MIASPSAVWSADKQNKGTVLIIRGDADSDATVHSVIKDSTRQTIREVVEDEVSDLVYSANGFVATMNDGKTVMAEKIIFSSYKKLDVSASSVKVKTDSQHIQLRYDATNTKTPEFWSLTTRKFDNGKITTFMNRKRHAFLCIS